MKTLAFAFKNNISGKILKQVQDDSMRDCKYFLFNTRSIEEFIEQIQKEKPQIVIGLGMYSGKDTDKLRLETICKNKFRNMSLGIVEKYNLNTITLPSPLFKYGKAMGNSYCNLASYKIMELIKENNLNTKYYFIHIPKDFYEGLAVSEIKNLVNKTFL